MRKPRTDKPTIELQSVLKFVLILLASTILSFNAIKSIVISWRMITMYPVRQQQIQKQYLQIIKKKNELEFVTSPFYIEQQLRNSLNYYKPDEKAVIFTSPIQQPTNQKPTPSKTPAQMWKEVLGF